MGVSINIVWLSSSMAWWINTIPIAIMSSLNAQQIDEIMFEWNSSHQAVRWKIMIIIEHAHNIQTRLKFEPWLYLIVEIIHFAVEW